jgi:hypothetical protein
LVSTPLFCPFAKIYAAGTGLGKSTQQDYIASALKELVGQ